MMATIPPKCLVHFYEEVLVTFKVDIQLEYLRSEAEKNRRGDNTRDAKRQDRTSRIVRQTKT